MSQKMKAIPMSKRFFPGLLPIVGDENYRKVLARYRELYSHHKLPENSTLQWHLTEGILPGLALYQVLRESGKSQESTLALINQTLKNCFPTRQCKMKLRNWSLNLYRVRSSPGDCCDGDISMENHRAW